MKLRKKWTILIMVFVLTTVIVGIRWYMTTSTFQARRLLAELRQLDQPDKTFTLLMIYFGLVEEKQKRDGEEIVEDLIASGESAVPVLIGALKDDDEFVQESALRALGEIGPESRPAVPALIEMLTDNEDTLLPYLAASALGNIGKEAAPELIKALKNENVEVRRAAAEALSFIGSQAREFVPAIVGSLQDEDMVVRQRTAWAFAKIGASAPQAVPELMTALEDEDDEVRIYAAQALGEIGDEAEPAISALTEVLKNDENVRWSAKNALIQIGAAAAPELTKNLKDSNAQVRLLSAMALIDIDPPVVNRQVINILIDTLKNKDSDFRTYAAQALGKIGPAAQAAVPTLKKSLKDNDFDIRIKSAAALVKIDPEAAGKQAVNSLIQTYNSAEEEIRRDIIIALGEIGPAAEEVVPTLIRALKDQDWLVPDYALEALAKIGPQARPAIPALKEVLKIEVNSSVGFGKSLSPVPVYEEINGYRLDIVSALARIDPAGEGKNALDVIIQALDDKDYDERWQVVDTLAQIGPVNDKVISTLIRAVKDEKYWIRRYAINALAQMGPKATEAVPVLQQALNDKYASIRRAAAHALQKIEGNNL